MSSVFLAVDPVTDMDKTFPTSENGRWSGMTTAGGDGDGGLMGSHNMYFLADDKKKRMKSFFYFFEIPSH